MELPKDCWCGSKMNVDIRHDGYAAKCPNGHMTVVRSFMDAANTTKVVDN